MSDTDIQVKRQPGTANPVILHIYYLGPREHVTAPDYPGETCWCKPYIIDDFAPDHITVVHSKVPLQV